MQILTFSWILLAVSPVIISGQLEKQIGSKRSVILTSILLQERRYDRMSKRRDSVVSRPMPYECCPALRERIEPYGGISREGKVLELYRDSRTVQTFYQTRCRPWVVNGQCHYLDVRAKRYSRCVQKYTYMYGIVKDYNVTQPYRVDYIKVKSGCTCELDFHRDATRYG
ncbi:uncharacterized protein [Haliotis cracherodii]|uniref:uncharacterized protein LOC124135728 n=1 Tax=Haliotis rufescens TaxID=6454 RepID=UPI001EAFD5D6|nr:uncharacterized protein LOC124135728 [Haliotis rufescens]XP_046357187.1 uncharacterized protein LOC124135728 [Haliotis rufescens]XP_046357189.1 uncharacterized protein LOC124135728 [Haliotis rufescens]XP_046357190.1 uncharacterized protein LOC124135728 [Haliotis rufescens]